MSSPHYLYPRNKLYFSLGEYEEKLQDMRTKREEIAKNVLSNLVKPEENVLEFGCGPGFIISTVANYCNQATGVDVSQATIRIAEELNSDVKNVSFQRVSGRILKGLSNESFSFIYSIECIQHIDKVHAVTFSTNFNENYNDLFI